MKKLLKVAVPALVIFLLLACFYIFFVSPSYVVPILMYHRFGYEEGTLFVTPENFSKQMDYLQNKNYKVISLEELVNGIKSGKKFPRNSVVITIDDGYEDNHKYAYPVLKNHNFPATIFIVSSYIDNNPEYFKKKQMKEMMENGITFGGHTRSNVYLPDIKDKKVLYDEIAGCKKDIEAILGEKIKFYCYPTGGFTEEIKQMTKDAGFEAACTTNRGISRFNTGLYELKRVKITNSDTNKPFSFWAKLSGYYNLLRRPKTSY